MKPSEKDGKTMETVLVVEDSRAMQRTLQRLLEADSLQVQIASDGIAGLETFRKQPPSAVLLDLKLPGLSGKELCREFKAIAASVPIVVLSANAEVEDKVLLLELGADDYVTKPFSPRELLARATPGHAAQQHEESNRFQRSGEEYEPRSAGVRRCARGFHQHGSVAGREAGDFDRAGIQAPQIFRRFPGTGADARRAFVRSLGLSELSFHSVGRQSHFALTSKTRAGLRQSTIFPHPPRRGV